MSIICHATLCVRISLGLVAYTFNMNKWRKKNLFFIGPSQNNCTISLKQRHFSTVDVASLRSWRSDQHFAGNLKYTKYLPPHNLQCQEMDSQSTLPSFVSIYRFMKIIELQRTIKTDMYVISHQTIWGMSVKTCPNRPPKEHCAVHSIKKTFNTPGLNHWFNCWKLTVSKSSATDTDHSLHS